MAGRPLTTAHANAIAKAIVGPLWFLEIGFSTPLRLTSGITRTWNGLTWTEAKMKVSGIRFDGSIGQTITIDLADPTDAYAVLCAGQKLTERAVSLWLADIDAVATADPIAMPALLGDSYNGSDSAVQIQCIVAPARDLPTSAWGMILPDVLFINQNLVLAWGSGRLELTVRDN